MVHSNIIDSITDKLIGLPDQTEVSIAIIKNGSTRFLGFLKKEGSLTQTDNKDAAFEIGSITKVFTANILAQLVAEGQINLDDLIEKHLPFKLLNSPLITLKHLVSHTSGLPRLPGDFLSYPDYLAENPYLNYSEERLISYLTKDLQLENSPGTQFLYSNLGAGVLSYVLSQIENKKFALLVAERIFKPLDMAHSAFDKNEMNTAIVKGIGADGAIAHHWDGGILNGALGIISTATDMSKFALKALELENKVYDLQLQEITTVRQGVMIGMGWAGSKDTNKSPVYWHNGGSAGYAASIAFNRADQTAVVILSNIEPHQYNKLIGPYVLKLL
ncbi:MAG: hypothetical protein JWR38_2664 [Mucilaginibacter sp.]|nr:hypothetical protein [Mucilaginibacter sp.]